MADPYYLKMRSKVDKVRFQRKPNSFYGFDKEF